MVLQNLGVDVKNAEECEFATDRRHLIFRGTPLGFTEGPHLYRRNGEDWHWLPEQFDASILPDEAAAPGTPNFTGAFVGMCCQDLSGARRSVDFDFFLYRERGYLPDPRNAKDETRD